MGGPGIGNGLNLRKGLGGCFRGSGDIAMMLSRWRLRHFDVMRRFGFRVRLRWISPIGAGIERLQISTFEKHGGNELLDGLGGGLVDLASECVRLEILDTHVSEVCGIQAANDFLDGLAGLEGNLVSVGGNDGLVDLVPLGINLRLNAKRRKDVSTEFFL